MVREHHQLSGHESGQTLGGRGTWRASFFIRKEFETTQWLNNNNKTKLSTGTTRWRNGTDLEGLSSCLLHLTLSNQLSFLTLWLQNYLSSPFMPSSLTLLLCGFILLKEYKGSTERKRINIRQTLNPANVALKEKLRTCTSLFGSFKRHCQAKGTKF